MAMLKPAAILAVMCGLCSVALRADDPKNSAGTNAPPLSAPPSGDANPPSAETPPPMFQGGPRLTPQLLDYWKAVRALSGERYVIGVALTSIPEGLHARLGLEPHSGLVVSMVQPDMPAAKAGVKQYDLLLKIDDKPVGNPGDVVRLVNEAQGKEVMLTLLRDQEPFQVHVTPVAGQFPVAPDMSGSAIQPADAEFPPGVRIIGPGVIMSPPSASELHSLRAELELLRQQQQQLAEQVRQLTEQLKKP